MEIEDAPTQDAEAAAIDLESVARDVEYLQAIIAVRLSDGRTAGRWARSDSGTTHHEELATVIATVYSACDGALDGWRAPHVTLETGANITLLRRSGQHVVATVYDRSAPLGLVRLSSENLVASISEPLARLSRLPTSAPPSIAPPTQRPSTQPPVAPTPEPTLEPTEPPVAPTPEPTLEPTEPPVAPTPEPPVPAGSTILTEEDTADSPAPADGDAPDRAELGSTDGAHEQTLMAGQVQAPKFDPSATLASPRMGGAAKGSSPPDSERAVETVHYGRDLASETDDVARRTARLLEFLEARAPEPHILKLRIALRSGLSLVALDHPETLGEDALVLLETAVEDILGIDRAELSEAL